MKKSLRFTVFKRDLFACQYCGRTPPAVVLEADHIVPVVDGGLDDLDNLITACFDCNRGKAAKSLSDIPQSLVDRAAQIAEKESQLKAYKRLVAQRRKREDVEIDAVQQVLASHFPHRVFSPSFRESVRINFLSKLSCDVVVGAMHLACARVGDPERAISYFCKVCWNQIRGDDRHV